MFHLGELPKWEELGKSILFFPILHGHVLIIGRGCTSDRDKKRNVYAQALPTCLNCSRTLKDASSLFWVETPFQLPAFPRAHSNKKHGCLRYCLSISVSPLLEHGGQCKYFSMAQHCPIMQHKDTNSSSAMKIYWFWKERLSAETIPCFQHPSRIISG